MGIWEKVPKMGKCQVIKNRAKLLTIVFFLNFLIK
jgi:hypothetical protein